MTAPETGRLVGIPGDPPGSAGGRMGIDSRAGLDDRPGHSQIRSGRFAREAGGPGSWAPAGRKTGAEAGRIATTARKDTACNPGSAEEWVDASPDAFASAPCRQQSFL